MISENDLQKVGEFGLIDRIAAQVGADRMVVLGIGDDAAAVRPTFGLTTLCTSDMLVEGIHFDLTLSDPFTLGRKSLTVNLSDIAAMGGTPRFFLLSLALPRSCTVDFMDRFTAGLLACAGEHGVTLVGGDTCASPDRLVISITLLGEQAAERTVARHGARPGDRIFVTGVLGDSALGLAKLRAGERSGNAVQRHLAPSPRLKEGKTLAARGLATAMIDVSDGLLADLGHILDRSHVGARLALDKVPLSAEYRDFFQGTEGMYEAALAGGEDYELLFTAPPYAKEKIFALFAEFGTAVTEIGEIREEEGLSVIGTDGKRFAAQGKGYDHFKG